MSPKGVPGEHQDLSTVAEVAAQGRWQVSTMTAYSLTPYESDFSGALTTPELRFVRLDCGQEVTVVGMGDVTVRGDSGKLTFTKVHLVPGLGSRQLSVPYLLTKGFEVVFEGTDRILSRGTTVRIRGERRMAWHMECITPP